MSDGIFDASEPINEEPAPAVSDESTIKGWLQAMGVSIVFLVAAAFLLGATIWGDSPIFQGYYVIMLAVLAGISFGCAYEAVKAARKGLCGVIDVNGGE